MKKLLIALLFVSTGTFAEHNFYVGANGLFANKTKLKKDGVSNDATNDASFAIYGGFRKQFYPVLNFGADIHLGLEFEYQQIAEAEITDYVDTAGNLSTVTVDGNAYYVNSRIKISGNKNPVYTEVVLGIGNLETEAVRAGVKHDESTVSYQAGVDIGFAINQFDLVVGARYRLGDLDGEDITITGLLAGVRYNF